MRHEAMPSDLPILSAEQYLDGPFPGKTGRAKQPSTSKPETAPRKRAKVSPPTVETESAEDGEDDGAKRARGRPRIDTKDQTAAEVGQCSTLSSPSLPPLNYPVLFLFSSARAFARAAREAPLKSRYAHFNSTLPPPRPVIICDQML